ncbi:MAG: hypothetical protein KAX57_12650 [Rhodoferax sp.]|jgi:hypothetical protein|uniref:DUF6858 family protein n=1 Tax=Rhodoferax sp. TaxID=50421 RepID=UPI001B6B27EF|nr:hypothetical protein [Rhodoferax sp.]MBP8287671.1 hypothetical protein [Rhodoferax sp.]MBP9148733.1 hypothetical protein [Rhodoferax sp.]MBP9737091.1 hypothetical protein [Rhodoferax sp.]
MKQLHFQQKYPISVAEIAKSETSYTNVAEMAEYFRQKIDATDKVAFIGTFDHHAHTNSFAGEIASDIVAATNVIFCFGHAIPNPQVLAVRPRSIGIADLGDHFVVSYMDAPMKPANDAMQAWTLALRNKA